MIPEAIDLLCIPVLMNEVPLRPINDEEAIKIAAKVVRVLPSSKEMKIIVIPALYYVSDLFNRMLFDEIPVNSVAIAGLMERRGSGSNLYIFNPFSSNGLLPVPNSVEDGDGSLTWAVLPVVAFGAGYIDLDEYPFERDDIDAGLEDLGDVLSEVYGLTFVQAFPPVLVEDLLDEINLMEEELRQDLGGVTSAS